MKDARHKTRLGSLFRLAVRGFGLLGLIAAAVGGVITRVEAPAAFAGRSVGQLADAARQLIDGSSGQTAQIGALLLLGGAAAVLLWVAVEVLGGLFLVAGRKTAAGAGGAVQVGLAAALLVVANAVSFTHFARLDATRDARFTLDPELVEQLKKLDPNAPTTVVVLQKDKLSATDTAADADALTTAAQQKITEKVLDLIDELRQHPDLTARFNVHVLHTKDELYEAALADLTEPLPERKGETDAERKARTLANRERQQLKAAVEAAPENSVFVTGNGRVQRLPFNQFYMLDKSASLAAGEGSRTKYANLVLTPQGKSAFVKKLLDLEQKRPKVGLLTIHPYLTSQDGDESRAVFTAAGMRTALEQNGFEVIDVMLKKGWNGESPISPAASTFDESKLNVVEAEYLAAADALTEATIQVQSFELLKKRTETGTLAELDRIFRKGIGRAVTSEADRLLLLKRLVEPNLEVWRNALEDAKKEAAEKEPRYLKYLGDDKVLGNRRSADVKAKLAAVVGECDLLVLPRLTTVNLVEPFVIPPSLFYLVKDQTEVVKEFLTAGKPVLFALGPTQVGRAPRPGEDPPDDIEKMLARMGIEAGDQTIITPVEAAEMARQRGSGAFGGKMPDLPTLRVELKPKSGKSINPVAVAFDQTSRTAPKGLEVKRSGYRPLYVTPQLLARSAFAPEVLITTADAWNEDRPLAEGQYVPKFEPTKPDDAKKGTREEERRQSYVVGVAAEVPIPTEWVNPKAKSFQRLAAAAVGGGPLGPGLPLGLAAALVSPDDLRSELVLPVPPPRELPRPTTPGPRPALLESNIPNYDRNRPLVRVAVFGHGGLFNGPKLDAGQEALLVNTVNWQLKREDRLPVVVPDAERWQYPRVPLDAKRQAFWVSGMAVGLPLAAAFLGVIALMLRRLR